MQVLLEFLEHGISDTVGAAGVIRGSVIICQPRNGLETLPFGQVPSFMIPTGFSTVPNAAYPSGCPEFLDLNIFLIKGNSISSSFFIWAASSG